MTTQPEISSVHQHPGVQGLAQIGRNAIDRVIELEQARARDNIAFKQLLAQRDALLEALKELTGHANERFSGGVWDRARAAIKAVKGEMK